MSEAQSNVFLTYENLAISMPLILTVAVYVSNGVFFIFAWWLMFSLSRAIYEKRSVPVQVWIFYLSLFLDCIHLCVHRIVCSLVSPSMRTPLTVSFLSHTFTPQAYFTVIPLKYGLPALGVLFILYQIRSQMIART